MVDTSHLIKNERDIFTSKKMACVAQDDQLVTMILSSPTKNILSKVYYEKTKLRPNMVKERQFFKSGRCLLYRDMKLVYELVKTGRKIEH